jgi:carboxyl-terminal processing protease
MKKHHIALSLGGFMLMGLLMGYYIGATNTAEARIFEQVDAQVASSQENVVVDRESNPKKVGFNLYWQVWDMVKSKYLYEDEINEKDLFYGSIEGIVDSLDDPYSKFFKPVEAKSFTDSLQGSFEGIGAQIGIRNDILTIIAPIEGMPAEKAGIMAGDMIVKIDDLETTGLSIEEAVSKIKGPRGTNVVLTIAREGAQDFQEITITRDKIEINSVKWEKLSDKTTQDIYMIRVSSFSEDTMAELDKAIEDMTKQNVDGIILDLRNNPGGFLGQAIQMLGLWLDNKVAVIESYRGGQQKKDWTNENAILGDIPTVVLINRGSASASEIVAGALQDHGRATVIGEKSFGKGSVQTFDVLPDGSALKVTVAEWLTPKGRQINKKGVEPDLVIKRTIEDFENEVDPQLDKAIEFFAVGQSDIPEFIKRHQESVE